MSENKKILIFNAKINQMLGLEQNGSVHDSDMP